MIVNSSLVLFLFIFLAPNDWSLTNTEIYTPVLPTQAAAGNNGDFFLSDIFEYRVVHFDKNGKKMPYIGRKGNGPGEFASKILALDFFGDFLYVFEAVRDQIVVYRENGSFVKRVKCPFILINPLEPPRRLYDGWLVSYKRRLRHLDDDFKEIAVLAETPSDDGTVGQVRKYRPASDRPHYVLSADRRHIYFYEPGDGFAIKVYDPATRATSLLFRKDVPNTRFDEDWGRHRFENRRVSQSMLDRYTWEPDFPDFFPDIVSLHLDFENHLHIARGAIFMEPDLPYLVFDLSGEPVANAIPTKQLPRILAQDGDWLYVAIYRGDELGIRKLRKTDYRRNFVDVR